MRLSRKHRRPVAWEQIWISTGDGGNGSEFPVEISLSPVATEQGAFVLSAIRDISDRKRIAEELRRVNEELHQRTAEQLGEYRARLASIIDSSEDAILSKGLDGTITSWNRGAERIYGYAPEEARWKAHIPVNSG